MRLSIHDIGQNDCTGNTPAVEPARLEETTEAIADVIADLSAASARL